MVGLDKLGDDLVAALATAAGVHAPAPPSTLAEEKQVFNLIHPCMPLCCFLRLALPSTVNKALQRNVGC